MALIALIARRAFVWEDRALRVGDRFQTHPIDAVLLVASKKAVFARVKNHSVPTPPTLPTTPIRTDTRRTPKADDSAPTKTKRAPKPRARAVES